VHVGGTPPTQAAIAAIPIVMVGVGDPVRAGNPLPRRLKYLPGTLIYL